MAPRQLTRGRNPVAAPIEVSDIRVLARSDLAVLAQPRIPVQIQTIRDTHHRLARAVATGLSNAECAEACGCSVSRVALRKADPAFMELVAHYRGMLSSNWAQTADSVSEYLGSVRNKSLAMLSDKLDAAMENDEFLPTRDLLGIAELGLDRTGYGKVNKNVNVNIDFAANLEAARRRSASIRSGVQTIEASSTRPQSVPGGESHSAPLNRRVPSPPLAAGFRRI